MSKKFVHYVSLDTIIPVRAYEHVTEEAIYIFAKAALKRMLKDGDPLEFVIVDTAEDLEPEEDDDLDSAENIHDDVERRR